MTEQETLALAHDVRGLLKQAAFHRVFEHTRNRLVAALEQPTTETERSDLVAELRALRKLRSGFDSLVSQAETIRSNNDATKAM
jgi:hypothetical protein